MAVVVRIRRAIAVLAVLAGGFGIVATPAAAQQSKPAKPTGLEAVSVSHDSVTLGWDDPDDGTITGYRILRRDIVNQTAGTFTAVAEDTADAATSYTDTTIEPETRYSYRIVAINPHGSSGKSKNASVRTLAGPAPGKPTGLEAVSVSHDSVTLGWDDPDDGTITGYRILRRDIVNQTAGTFTAVAEDTADAATSYTDTTIEPETRYSYRIVAINPHGSSGKSMYASVRTSAVPAPGKPTGLEAVSVSHDSVTLGWDDPDDGTITGYRILRRDIVNQTAGTFTAVAEDTADAATSYTDTTIEPETRYSYRIVAINPHGSSGKSKYASVRTLAGPGTGFEQTELISTSPLQPQNREVSQQQEQEEEDDATGFIDLDAGWSHACALHADGQIACWGTINNRNQYRTARSPASSNRYVDVTASRYGSCGVLEDGTIHCFDGYAYHTDPSVPETGIASVSQYSDGSFCWLLQDGSVGCQGSVPNSVAAERFQSVHAGGVGFACGLTTSNHVRCWRTLYGTVLPAPEGEFTSLSFGGNIGCGIKIDGTVQCWAVSWDDVTWNPLGFNRPSPSGTFTQIDSGYWVSCGVRTDQSVECWSNRPENWSPGNDPIVDFTPPPEGSFTKVSVDFWYFACGLKTDGSVVCWGDDEYYMIAGIYDEPAP
ncbi:fibronectin type III domain-containing protein [Candidatus Poriferisodalis sp.]|uniref:fibronectin type III domain-containing protein n=1 Tax=Candidatus Poriferisodalis sp. TaxID=3101277 RepID=UPI003B010570